MNEQNIFTGHGWLEGMHPTGKVDDMKTFYQVNLLLVKTHFVVFYKDPVHLEL